MGRIIGGFATSHVMFQRTGHEAMADRVFAGMAEIGRRVDALMPDIVVIISNDHMINFNTRVQVPFVAGIARSYTPLGDLDLPTDPIPGHPDFAQSFVDHANANGYDLGVIREARPDHGVTIPSLFAVHGARAMVPLYTNVDMRPVSSMARCHRLGQLLADHIRDNRPADERVVVLGAGGLSHWIGVARQGKVNEAWDRWVLARLEAGDIDALLGLSIDEIEEKSGNGGVEIINWMVMLGALGAVGGHTAETIYYEPFEAWWTGMAGIEVKPG